MPPFTATNTIYCEPIMGTTTSTSATSPTIYTTIGPSSISFVQRDTEEKTKEYCDKVDQHVDKLEEDIEFLNEKRKSNEELIDQLIYQNSEMDTKIKTLESSVTFLKNYTSHLEALINMLQDKVK